MKEIYISDRVLVLLDVHGYQKWRQAPGDKIQGISPFLTYIGGNNWQKLDSLVSSFESLTKSHQRGVKRFKGIYKYELKVWGLSWTEMLLVSEKLSPDTFRRDLEIVC